MIVNKFDFFDIRLYGKLCVNFHYVTVKDTSCTIRLLAKFELLSQASNKTRLNTFFANKRQTWD